MPVIAAVSILAVVGWIAVEHFSGSSQSSIQVHDSEKEHNEKSNSPITIASDQVEEIPNQSDDQILTVAPQQPTARQVIKLRDLKPKIYNSLPTGTRIGEDADTRGHGKLTVKNGTSEDAVVRLYGATEQPLRQFFVQSNSMAQIDGIPEGRHQLAFTTGLDWIESEETFRWHPEYFEFDQSFVYIEHMDSEGIEFDHVSVTLHSVLNGNMHRRSITREQFLKGHLHIAVQR